MVFKLARTYTNPPASQSGFAPIGAGAQVIGGYTAPPVPTGNKNVRPTKGSKSWLFPASGASAQRGFPSPLAGRQARPAGTMPNVPPVFGGIYQHYTPYYDRGAAAYVPNTGYVLSNPIGAGIVALHRPQASYGPGGQYYDSQIWWTSQAIPTSVNLQGLTSPDILAGLLSEMQVYGVVRTTG